MPHTHSHSVVAQHEVGTFVPPVLHGNNLGGVKELDRSPWQRWLALSLSCWPLCHSSQLRGPRALGHLVCLTETGSESSCPDVSSTSRKLLMGDSREGDPSKTHNA